MILLKYFVFFTLLFPLFAWSQSTVGEITGETIGETTDETIGETIGEFESIKAPTENEKNKKKKEEEAAAAAAAETKVVTKKPSTFSENFKVTTQVATEREVEYLNLVTDVYKDVKFEDLPDEAIFKLEDTRYRKYADIIYDNERKVMRFKPKKTGSFTLRFVNKRRPHLILKQVKVYVQRRDLDKVASEIKSLLKEIEGIEIKILNNKVIVDGFILLAKDMNRIAMVLKQYGDQVASLVRLSPLTKRKIADRIEAEIDNPNIYVDIVNDFYILEGSESWLGEAKKAEKIAQAHISDTLEKFAVEQGLLGSSIKPIIKDPNPIINNIVPLGPQKERPKKLIQIVVHYVELSKKYNRGFNFSWAPSITESEGQGLTIGTSRTSGDTDSNFVQSFTAVINRLLPRLNWARGHGHARILNTMNVLVEEGQTGTVNNRRQIQQTVSQGAAGFASNNGQASIATTVKPTTSSEKPDDIRMDISVEIQEILNAEQNQVETVGNNVKTVVSVRNKQTAAIGGLLRSRSSTGYNGDPENGSNILFRLGAAKNLSREYSQFVVFLTPIQKPTASQGVERVKKKFRIDK